MHALATAYLSNARFMLVLSQPSLYTRGTLGKTLRLVKRFLTDIIPRQGADGKLLFRHNTLFGKDKTRCRNLSHTKAQSHEGKLPDLTIELTL